MTTTGLGYSLLFAAMVGTASLFSKRGLQEGSFEALLFVSLAIGTPIFVVAAALTSGMADLSPVGVGFAAISGLFGSVLGRAFYFLGIEHIGPGKSLSINATSPLFVAVLSILFLEEAISAGILVGTVLIVLGVVGISADAKLETIRSGAPTSVVLFPVLSAILVAVAVTFRKIALGYLDPIQVGTVNMSVSLLLVLPFVAYKFDAIRASNSRFAVKNYAIAGSIMGTGFIFYFLGLDELPANVFFPLIQTQPLFAVLLSAAFLGQVEIISYRTIGSAVVVVSGAVLVVLG